MVISIMDITFVLSFQHPSQKFFSHVWDRATSTGYHQCYQVHAITCAVYIKALSRSLLVRTLNLQGFKDSQILAKVEFIKNISLASCEHFH